MSINSPAHIAKHFREIYFGGNWTCVNLKDTLRDVTWQQAAAKLEGFNTIAALTYHMGYYVSAVLKVLQGGALEAKDAYSYNCPPIQSAEDWQSLLDKCWEEAAQFAVLLEQLPEQKLWENFTDEKYGPYYRNMHGIIEHCHYHLGQVVILKKLLAKDRVF